MLEFHLGFVSCGVCVVACVLFVCYVVVRLYDFRWDSYASHLMVNIGDHHA